MRGYYRHRMAATIVVISAAIVLLNVVAGIIRSDIEHMKEAIGKLQNRVLILEHPEER